ncbi:MAG TPA: ABC transporter permease, partial [Anaerolineales bacterium]|nr:ABC transporter permease [Anaerolineales bacterium]
LIFFLNLFIGLALSRRYGGWLDKIYVALAPLSAAPGWFYGIFLILIFASWLGVLPFGGMVDTPKPKEPILYALNVAKHMILPLAAMLLSSHFIGVYSNRTFFLIYSSEDYVELAKAKGLPDRALERRYILRPTMPTIVTGFLLSVITLWLGAIIFETVFNWPGNGRLYYQAIGLKDVPVIVGDTVIYAYLLAASVFLLDLVYAVLDPRVRVGGSSQ